MRHGRENMQISSCRAKGPARAGETDEIPGLGAVSAPIIVEVVENVALQWSLCGPYVWEWGLRKRVHIDLFCTMSMIQNACLCSF